MAHGQRDSVPGLWKQDPLSRAGHRRRRWACPDYLAGLGKHWFQPAEFVVVVCRDCGLTRFYAEPEARKKLGEAKKWKPV